MVGQHPLVILDGGMGRHLLSIGAPFRQPEWSALALIEAPDFVERAHRDFIEAGADVITTNSYALVPFHIGHDRFMAEGYELAQRAVECARAAAPNGDHVRVAGSLPPLFGSYEPELFDEVCAPSIIDPLIDAMAPDVDLWLAETMSSTVEVTAVREALQRAGDSLPLWVSYTVERRSSETTLRSGESIELAVQHAADLGASAVLFNCCEAELVEACVQAAQRTAPHIANGGYANRFVTSHGGEAANDGFSDYRDELEVERYAHMAHGWVHGGASIIGGCCGIGPDYIAAIANRLRS